MSFRDIFNQYYDEYFKVNPINKGLKFIETDKLDVVGWETQGRQQQLQQEALSSPKKEDVFVIKEDNNIKIKQTIDKDTYTEANIDTKNATASIKIHDGVKDKDYECVKMIIDNTETNIDQKLFQILNHPNYRIENSFMFTIIKLHDSIDFDASKSDTYKIIKSFNNFINTSFQKYEHFRNNPDPDDPIELPKITREELVNYDNILNKIIDNMIKIKIDMVNNISRKVQPNDIFFFRMRSDMIGQTNSSPVTNIHLDSCNFQLPNTDYTNNHYCEITAIYYFNIKNKFNSDYTSSALFFYGPEIPTPLSMNIRERIMDYQMNDLSKAPLGSSFFDEYKRVVYGIPIKNNSYIVWYNKPLKYKRFNFEEVDTSTNLFYNSLKSSKTSKAERIGTPDSKNFMLHFSPIPLRDTLGLPIPSSFLPNYEGSSRGFINPRLSNINIFSTIRYIFSFDSTKDQTIQKRVRNNNLNSLCIIAYHYLSFQDFNYGELNFNSLAEECSKILKDILIKIFDIDLDKIIKEYMNYNFLEKGEKIYYPTNSRNFEIELIEKLAKIVENKTELITYQAKKFQELIKIKYETYFLNKSKDPIPFNELYKYLLSIQESITHKPLPPHTFTHDFLKHLEEKDKQYYKKYLKYKSKYINIKNKL